jgi:MFS family permease
VDPVLFAAMVVGLLLRAWQFGAIPPGLNQDEASTAYDAFSLIHYGVDRNGFRFPVVLVSWGSGMYALASYVEAPFIGLFGLSVWSARLPFLLIGLAALPLFYRLLRDTTDRRTARIGVALLAVSPWHVMVSRWGLDCNVLPFALLLATVLLVRSAARPRSLVWAALVFGLALYAYGTAYLVVPVFLALALFHGVRRRLWPVRTMLWAGATFALVALPIGLFVAINSLRWDSIRTPIFSIPRLTGVPRFRTMGNLQIFSAEFVRQAVANLGQAAELFRSQDDGLIWNAIPGYGILYGFSTLLALAGLALLVGKSLGKARQSSFPLLAWAVAAMVLMAFVAPNLNRANAAMLPFIFCVAIASSLLWQYRPLAILLCALLAGSLAGFVGAYFGNYRQTAAGPFFASFGEAIRYASDQTRGEVCVTDHVNMPYIFVLFYNQEDPRLFERTVRYDNPGAEFQSVSSFGRYRFGLGRCADAASVIVASPDEVGALGREHFIVKEFERYVVLLRPDRDTNVGALPASPAEPPGKPRSQALADDATTGIAHAASRTAHE